MKNLYDPARVDEVKARIAKLHANAERQWGTMTPSKAIAHCANALEMATGDMRPPRAFVGRIFGGIIKPMALGNDAPIKRNSPTARELVIDDERDLGVERARLVGLIDQFVAAGPSRCTTHPHPFFGKMTPEQWAILMYKHLDHHLRQFGV